MKKINPLSFGLTKDKKIPFTKFLGTAIWPWEILRILPKILKWDFYKDEEGNIHLIRNKAELITNDRCARLTVKEWEFWLKSYQLPRNKKINKILDVGSGTGETMFFYDRIYDVKNFIGVEIDSGKVKLNRRNIKLHNWDAKVYNEPFKLEHFKEEDFDFAKIDCEGGERVLVGEEIKTPTIVETHTLKLKREFQEMGFEVLEKVDNNVFIMDNFGKAEERI